MTPTRDELIALRERQGLTREKIAEHYDVSLTTVRRWIKELNVPRPSKTRTRTSRNLARNGAIIVELDDGLTVLERAFKKLGPRVVERRGMGYFLDGRPSNCDAIVHAAGLKLKDEK